MKLTNKQKAFIEYYLGKANFNATEAALLAGYSKKTAYSIGQENLKKPEILEHIEDRMNDMVMSANETMVRLSQQASSAYSNYLQSNGTVDLDSLLADGKGHLIKGFKHTKHGLNVEFYAADKALQNVAKAHGIFTDKIEVKVEGELDKLLDQLESNLDTETYDRILSIIQGSQS